MASVPTRIMNCTAATPMPLGVTTPGESWYHHGAAPLPGQPAFNGPGTRQLWRCRHCTTEFWVTATKSSIAEAIAKTKDMKARGWRRQPGDK